MEENEMVKKNGGEEVGQKKKYWKIGGNIMNIGYAVGTIMILIGAVLIVLALIL